MKEVFNSEKIEKAEYVYRRIGLLQEHNYLCACCKEFSAIANCNSGVLSPCRMCQLDYNIIKKTYLVKWLIRLGVIDEN